MKKIYPLLLLILILAAINIWVWLSERNPIEVLGSVENHSYAGFHYAASGNKDFYGNAESANPLLALNEPVYGGIASHHMFVAGETAEYFSGLKASGINPKTIIILGPNHFNNGADILVSRYAYKTPWGIIEPESKIINSLIESNVADNDEQPFEQEHSISALAGFIKNSFPEAKIAPIIIKRSISAQKAEELASKLNELLPAASLVLASVDFSHHQNRVAAQYHDDKSISAIQNFDFENISKLEIDSPPTIYALLKYLEFRGASRMVYANTNSALFSKNLSSEDVTSYVFAYFLKGKPASEENISILSFGDMMLDRDVKKSLAKGADLFGKIRGTEGNFLKGADFISANLEGPITKMENCPDKEISFKFSPDAAGMLAKNNFNIMNLANNHAFDCGKQGLADTKRYLAAAGISHFGGLDDIAVKKVNDQSVAFLGINATASVDIEKFTELATKLKSENNYVVVNIHWGIEYGKNPSEQQVNIAHKLIDSGADIIIGHHPHVVEPLEIYKNKPIFYSLGNFIFDQFLPGANDGLGIGIILSGNKIDLRLFPFQIKKFQPELLSYSDSEKFCNDFLKDIPQKDVCMVEAKSGAN